MEPGSTCRTLRAVAPASDLRRGHQRQPPLRLAGRAVGRRGRSRLLACTCIRPAGGEPRGAAALRSRTTTRPDGPPTERDSTSPGREFPAAVVLIDIAIRQRTHVRDLAGPDPAGVTSFGPARVTPDGQTMTIGLNRILSTCTGSGPAVTSLRLARGLRLWAHRRAARPDAASTARLTPRGAYAPAARTSSLPSVGRLFAPRPGSSNPMTLAAGTKLGPYEIVGLLGAGGMGEVYRARDARLKRDVAIKVLPASFAQDADRLRRFEQEAQAAGGLNHPNITSVYDLGSHDGSPYIVTELLEGETLRARLSGGALRCARRSDYAIQIAHGSRRGAREGDRAPGPEARERLRDERRPGQDPRLRPRQADADRGAARPRRRTCRRRRRHGARRRPRHARLHVARAGARASRPIRGRTSSPSARSSTRCCRGRAPSTATSAAETMSAILREEPPDLSATNQQRSAGPRAHRAPLSGEESRGALPLGARPRVRPRGALGHFEHGLLRGSDARAADPSAAGSGGRARDRRGARRRIRRRKVEGRLGAADLPAAHVSPRSDLGRAVRLGRQDHPDDRGLGREAVGDLRQPAREPGGACPSACPARTSPRSRRRATWRSCSTRTSTRPSPAPELSPASARPAGRRASCSRTSNTRTSRPTGRRSRSCGSSAERSDSSIRSARSCTRRRAGSGTRVSRHGATASPFWTTRSAATTAERSPSWILRAGRRRSRPAYASSAGLAWSPDGREVWYTAAEVGGNRSLYASSPSGKRRILARVTGSPHPPRRRARRARPHLARHDTGRNHRAAAGIESGRGSDLARLEPEQRHLAGRQDRALHGNGRGRRPGILGLHPQDGRVAGRAPRRRQRPGAFRRTGRRCSRSSGRRARPRS